MTDLVLLEITLGQPRYGGGMFSSSSFLIFRAEETEKPSCAATFRDEAPFRRSRIASFTMFGGRGGMSLMFRVGDRSRW